jgi:PAS domain S-box-containing protein
MLVLGISAFLSGILLLASRILGRGGRNREEQESLALVRQDVAARLAALESYPQALVMMDSRGLIRRVNGAAERLFGYYEAELLGHSILQLLPSAPSALDPAATRAAPTGAAGAAEVEVRCKDRSRVKVRMTANRSVFKGGSEGYMFFEAMFFETADGEEQPDLEQSQSHGAAVGG